MTVGKDVRYEGEMAKKIPPVSSLFSQNGLFLSQCSFPRCGKLHADWQPGTEKAGLPLPDELC